MGSTEKNEDTHKDLSHSDIEKEYLLRATKELLKNTSFKVTARMIFDFCCELTGAKSGYVALLSVDGTENDVLFLESGGMPCSVDPNLPMPIRGLREIAYRNNIGVFENSFLCSEWMQFLPDGHVELRNVMFSPLVVQGKTAGILGLANKPSDFTHHDLEIVQSFADLAALALERNHAIEQLSESEENYRHLFETLSDGIVLVDSRGRILEHNTTFENMLGYDKSDLQILNIQHIIPITSSYLKENFENVEKHCYDLLVSTKDGELIHTDLRIWGHRSRTGEKQFFISIHDVSDIHLIEEKDRMSNQELEMYASLIRHDLGNDLLLVNGVLQLVASKCEIPEDLERLMGSGMNAIKRMNNLLRVLRHPSEKPYSNIIDVIEDTVDAAMKIHTNLTIEFSPPPNRNPFIVTPSRLLPMIFENLFRNAAQHAGPNPSIKVIPEITGNVVEISVFDDGKGLSEDAKNNLFKRTGMES